MGRIHGNSTAGRPGPDAVHPEHLGGVRHGGDINDDHDAILAAGRYLAGHGGSGRHGPGAARLQPRATAYVAAVEAYAGVMLADPRAYDGYYQWQVYYSTTSGVVLLPEGYGTTR